MHSGGVDVGRGATSLMGSVSTSGQLTMVPRDAGGAGVKRVHGSWEMERSESRRASKRMLIGESLSGA